MSLRQQYPSLYRYISGFPEDKNKTAFPVIERIATINKTMLNEKLGLTDGTALYNIPPVDFSKTKTGSIKVLLYFLPEEARKECEENNYKALLENKLSNGQKVSRLLIRNLENNKVMNADGFFYVRNNAVLSQIRRELPNFDTGLIQYADNYDNFKSAIGVLVQNFYSTLFSDKNRKQGFSTNLYTMLSAATSTAFHSCFSLGGCNSRGPYTIALHPNTGVIFVSNDTNIIGRAWVYFNQDLSVFQVMRPYGFISDTAVLNMAKWLCAKISPEGSWKYVHDQGCTTIKGKRPGGWWLDPVKYTVVNSAVQKESTVHVGIDIVPSVESPCIICGEFHKHSEAICPNCERAHTAVCAKCGKLCYVDHINKDIVYICDECLAKEKRCPVCGEKLADDGTCIKCAWENKCFMCGEVKPDIRYYSGYPVCGSCRKLLVEGTCETCGKKTVTYVYKGHAYCEEHYVEAIHNSANK